ncbi:MAG: hypothetical protein MRERV_25c025 [Mycoplasmataceae bacterium RV_VA103A]|nr:MAG: hypothetical protein MRERV_25c025 [Mycoplasmataceae bacterium RV_VA103A]
MWLKINLTNCFYCQGLKNQPPADGGKCDFCGVYNNPLCSVNYQGQEKHFCCGCAWWQVPRSKEEKEAEAKWYQTWKKSKFRKKWKKV